MDPRASQPVLDELLRKKVERRRRLAKLPVEEKVTIVNRMIELVQPILDQKRKVLS